MGRCCELGSGQLYRGRAVVAPQPRDGALLEPLLEQAQPGAVPHQHLARLAALVHETGTRRRRGHRSPSRSSPSRRVRRSPSADPSVADTRRRTRRLAARIIRASRSTAIASSSVSPLIRNPLGDTTLTSTECGASTISTGTSEVLVAGDRRSVSRPMPLQPRLRWCPPRAAAASSELLTRARARDSRRRALDEQPVLVGGRWLEQIEAACADAPNKARAS